MTFAFALLFLAALMGIGALFLAVRMQGSKRTKNIADRLKDLTAPTRAVMIAPDVDIVLPDSWLLYLPSRLRPRVDKMLGATGYTVTLRTLLIVAVGGAIASMALTVGIMHLQWIFVVPVAFGVMIVAPYQMLGIMKSRHSIKFMQRFPDAIDLIVRAVRAGLPVLGSMEAAGQETPEPVGSEFRRVIADTRVGLTIEEALGRAASRIGLIEFNFFVASIQLQRESGGNLTETLATLSQVLRRRDELRAKTKALTAEARTSAMVLAAMPFVTGAAIAAISPGYFSPLFNDSRGGYILGGALCLIGGAMLSMRTMLRKSLA